MLSHLDIIGDNSQIQIQQSVSDPHISFDSVSRNLTLVQELDHDAMDIDSLTLELTCTILVTKQNVSHILFVVFYLKYLLS